MFSRHCVLLLLGFAGGVVAAQDPTQPPQQLVPASTSAGSSAPLQLQSIVRGAGHSRVVINGQSLGVGETLDGARVQAIYRHSVLVERQGQQEVLRLVEPIMKPSR